MCPTGAQAGGEEDKMEEKIDFVHVCVLRILSTVCGREFACG